MNLKESGRGTWKDLEQEREGRNGAIKLQLQK